MPPTDDLTDDDLSDEDLTEDDLADEDLTDEDAGLLTEDIDDRVPLVRPPRLEDLVVAADIEDLVDPAPLLDLSLRNFSLRRFLKRIRSRFFCLSRLC